MNDKCISTFNELLRGERSAVETYQQALAKVDEHPEKAKLQDIHKDHVAAVSKLESHVRELGGTPDGDSGAWGTFAKAVEGTAKLFGDTAAVKALKEGEEHGLKEYKEALEVETLKAECITLLNERISSQQSHISHLNRIMETL